jgi:beta-lactamase superfamily II metal-dependent hydrolase
MKRMCVLASALLVSLLAGCNQTKNITSVEITKNSISVDDVEVLVGDKFKLEVLVNDNLKASLKWESSNTTVAQIDKDGNVTIVGKGEAIISVSVDGKSYVSDSLYLKSRNKVEQLGVGSGLTANDPIFLGNEGDEEPLEIRFIEMQQIYADSIFIKKGNVEILIDSGYGYDGDFVNQVVEQYCPDNRLDMLMLSHSDGDHIDGLSKALTAVDKISLMIDYGGSGSGTVLETRNKVKADNGIYHSAYDCVNAIDGASDLYYLTEDFYFEVLKTGQYVTKDKSSAGNGASVAVIFYYKDFSFFTAGDLTTSSEASLMRNETLPEVTLYKASHHGSNGSSSQELLDTLNPKAVAISASIAGKYGSTPSTTPNKNYTYNLDGKTGHPYEGAIERIYKAPRISQNLNVYWNGVNGTMKFTTYGTNDFTFEGSPTLKGYYDLRVTGGVPEWNEEKQDFKNRVTGEENFRLHETKMFGIRGYDKYLPAWAKQQA